MSINDWNKKMKLRNIIIRYSVLFVGIALWSYLMYQNRKSINLLDPARVIFALWNILPNIVYWVATIKLQADPLAKPLLVAPAVCLCGFQLWAYHAILNSHSSTAALAFLCLPLPELAVLGIGFLIGYVFYKGYL